MVTEQRTDIALWSLRAVAAAMLAVMAIVHIVLWVEGYRDIPIVGPGFLLNGIGGLVLAVAVLLPLGRWNPLVAVLGALFALGSLGALVMSLTIGFFGVSEQITTPSVIISLLSEAIALVVLIVIARRTAPSR